MNNSSQVYDIFLPSPVTLKEIAMVEVAVELWRQEIREHRANGTLKKLNFAKIISSSTMNLQAPSMLLPRLDECIERIGSSIQKWLDYHDERQFFQFQVLQEFDDFVGDFDYTIHHRRTAERMILCDGISQVEKFKIACFHFLENDIEQLWPSVSSHFDLNTIGFSAHPQLFYWICRLKNQLYKMPRYRDLNEGDFEGHLFTAIAPYRQWPSVEYLFSRVDSPNLRKFYLVNIFRYMPEEFCRYMLAKLDEHDLDVFFSQFKSSFLFSLYYDVPKNNTPKVAMIWKYAKHKINEASFVRFFKKVMRNRQPFDCILKKRNDCGNLGIWYYAPDQFKKSVFQFVLLTESFRREDYLYGLYYALPLLQAALSDASFSDRRLFWDMHWCKIMKALYLYYMNEFVSIMTLCFENENEIINYKRTVMSQYEKIGQLCLKLFKEAQLDVLNKFLSICCPEKQTVRSIRLRLLHENFLNVWDWRRHRASKLNEFIDDIFDDADSVTEFKNQLVTMPSIVQGIEQFMSKDDFSFVREFIDMIPSAKIATDFKNQRILPIFRKCYLFGACNSSSSYDDENYLDFLRWCLKSEDKAVENELKQTVPIDEIVQFEIRMKMLRNRVRYCPALVEFLKWYLVTDEAYEKLVAKFSDDDVFVKLTTNNKKEKNEPKADK